VSRINRKCFEIGNSQCFTLQETQTRDDMSKRVNNSLALSILKTNYVDISTKQCIFVNI